MQAIVYKVLGEEAEPHPCGKATAALQLVQWTNKIAAESMVPLRFMELWRQAPY